MDDPVIERLDEALADARQKLAKARYDTLLAQIKLKQSVGALSLKDLEEINALLAR